VRIDGRLYVDGGLLDTLPVWAAAEMGATRVIAVNALPLMPSRSLRAAVRVVRMLGRKSAKASGIDLVTISPRGPLGSVRDAITWSAENVRKWIQQGEDDAEVSPR
jgi:predicted acylesterase/phospholipase RssA